MTALPIPTLAAGETYIGGTIAADGTVIHLILLPGDIEANWQQATEWAASIGGALPNRVEQAQLFATNRDAFKPRAYWLREEESSESGWAWYLDFSYGNQNGIRKHYELRARAVRRLVI